MNLPVVVREEAETDVAHAAAWYERQSAGLGADFVLRVDDCLELISRQPEIFPVVYRETRMGILRRFPYLVMYRLFPGYVSVVAVMHGRRHPKRWQARIKK